MSIYQPTINCQLSQELSNYLAQFSDVITGQPWQNAFCLLSKISDAEYVEGWAVSRESYGIFEHAWLEQAGTIIDPDMWQSNIVYFAALRFSAVQAEAQLAANGAFPLAHSHNTEELNNPANSDRPEYWAAWEKAVNFAEAQKRGELWGWWSKWRRMLSK